MKPNSFQVHTYATDKSFKESLASLAGGLLISGAIIGFVLFFIINI